MFTWYKYLIVSLVFSHLGFWSGSLFLIAPFPDLCLLVLFYKGEYYTLVHTTYENSGPYDFREYFLCFSHDACMDPRGMVGRICSRIYREDHFTLLHTKYESFGPCGFGEEDFLKFFT